jgi:hypothetical protein
VNGSIFFHYRSDLSQDKLNFFHYKSVFGKYFLLWSKEIKTWYLCE